MRVLEKTNKEKRKETEALLLEYKKCLVKQSLTTGDDFDLYIKKVERILDTLPDEQRRLLHHRYLEGNEITFDYFVQGLLGVSERTYYRIKLKALLNFYDRYFLVEGF